MSRAIKVVDAERVGIPLNIGVWGPSGCGKTYSALRLAAGIQKVYPGPIILIDTENKRGLHYADTFDYKHVAFDPPFSPLDYLDILNQIESYKPSVVIMDSFSHEHSFYLSEHERKAQELAKRWNTTPDKTSMSAWAYVAEMRKTLLEHIIRLDMNLISCFRAKEKTTPVKKNGKTAIENIGYQPLGGKEYVYEMTVSALLPPSSDGKAYFHTGKSGEDMMTKLPEQFKSIFSKDGIQLTEEIGVAMAKWAKGDSKPAKKSAPTAPPAELATLQKYLSDGVVPDKEVAIGKETVNLLAKAKGAVEHLKKLTGDFNSSTPGYKPIQQIIKAIEESQAEPEELDVSRPDKDQAGADEQELDIF